MTTRQDEASKKPSSAILRAKHDETPEAYGRRLADFLYKRATKPPDESEPAP